MRYLSIYKTVEQNRPPTLEEMNAMGKLIEESMKAGVLIATEGCLPSAKGARVRLDKGEVIVTDGPFTESKEVVGGFFTILANSLDEAVEISKECPDFDLGGSVEVREVLKIEMPA